MTNFLTVPLKLMLLFGLLLPVLSSQSVYNHSDHSFVFSSSATVPDHSSVRRTPPVKKLTNSFFTQRTSVNEPAKQGPDPIRFSIQCDKQQIRIGEEVNLTVTAQLLSISPSQLFFLSGANDYTLKMLLPPGFEQTGGDFTDYVSGRLSAESQPVVTYHVKGRFRTVTSGTSFRLLRSHGQASDQSLFAEKSTLTLQTGLPKAVSWLRKAGAGPTNSTDATLYVQVENSATGTARAAAPNYTGFLDQPDYNVISGKTMFVTETVTSTGSPLTVLAPTYNCQTGAITFNTSGGNGSPIRYQANGITGWTTDSNQYLDAGSRVNADTPLFTINVEQSGQTITYTWSRQATCNGTPPPVTTPPVTTPPAPPTPPTGNALTVLAPTYNCQTGAITFNTSGGDGTPIRYRSPGITGWTTDPNQYLDAGSRVNADTPPFTIYVEQSSREITYTWSRQATCTGTTPPPTTPPAPPTPPTPPVANGACAPGINTINYAWDGGNNSISIRINASAGNPELTLSGPTSAGWTNTFNLGNSVWYWDKQGMSAGTYTLSVRPAGDGGAGCSFSLSLPSAGKQLYPTGGGDPPSPPNCTPPSAPVLSASGGTQVCNNSTVTLTAAGCSGTVTWSGGQSGSSIGVSAAGTYSATCTLNGCTSAPSNQVTVTACSNTGNGRYNRVLYVGNSITLHGGSPFFIVNAQNPKRGMAATSPEKDYVHLMSAKHRELNQGVDNRTFASWNMGGQLDEATGPYWEGNSTKDGIDLSRFDPVAAWKPDLVYIRLGENVTDWEITNQPLYQSRLKALIDKLISQSPGAKVVLSTSVWGNPNYDTAIRAVGAERNYPIADFSDMWPNRLTNGYYALNPSIYGDAGTDNHPDDDGMAHMANKLWDATPK
ncbi:SGNH/GDSL hydrolase family protein [Spirosoma arcticum]